MKNVLGIMLWLKCRLTCFNLHLWALLYTASVLPLRFGDDYLARHKVESQSDHDFQQRADT